MPMEFRTLGRIELSQAGEHLRIGGSVAAGFGW